MLEALLAIMIIADPQTAATQAPPPTPDFAPLTEAMEQYVSACGLPGAAMIVMRGEHVLYEHYVGDYTSETVIPIASASKWLSGAVIMSLADDGLIDLDAPISTYLPQFAGRKGAMTVRQLFSHTSGLPTEHPMVHNRWTTLAEAADAIARAELDAPPGAEFRYGGVSMHVAGRIAEVVTGQPWNDLFAERLTIPLGMSTTRFGLLPTENPSPAGAAWSNLCDYSRFLQMLAAGGELDGVRVLSGESVAIMLADQTRSAPMRGAVATFRAPGARYGIGNWIFDIDESGAGSVNTSPGAFGFTPWLDHERGVIGVLMIEDHANSTRSKQNLPDLRAITSAILDGRPVEASPFIPRSTEPQRKRPLRDAIRRRLSGG
jgi:serine-type D-Ala-D-Ala carboxypeptidase/endopeptidase